MANIYVKESGTVFEDPGYIVQPLSVTQLLTSEDSCYVEGVQFIGLETPNWPVYLSDLNDRLKHGEYSDEEIERILNELCSDPKAKAGKYPVTTSFRAMKYPFLDGCPFVNFMADSSQNIVCNIIPAERHVDVLPYRGTDGKEKHMFFYDKSKAMGDGGIFYYDGNLQNALAELQKAGFQINLARWPTADDIFKFAERQKFEKYVISKENVPLEEAVQTK